MSERVDVRYSSEIEEALGTVFSAPEPDSAFVDRLERQLMAHHKAVATQPAGEASPLKRFRHLIWQPVRRHRWATVGIAVLLALAVAFLAVGPQRVWADLQRLLGYVPGVGFVNLEETRVLTAPVTVTRDGVTLRVEEVLAAPDGTTVVISSEGLPREDEVSSEASESEQGFEPRLRLPADGTLAPETFALYWGGGTLDFPPLPEDAYRVTLELPRLPLVPDGVAPEAWEVPLTLRPASGEQAGRAFPEPYIPPDASDTHKGITVRVLAAAHTEAETAVNLQLQWTNPDWKAWTIRSYEGPSLRDALGHVYLRGSGPEGSSSARRMVVGVRPETDTTPVPTPDVPTIEEVRTFAPVSRLAKHLTLTVGELTFGVAAEGSISVDLGDDPQVGDVWPLNLDMEVVGVPVRVVGARLTEEDLGPPEASRRRTVLEFVVDPGVTEEGVTLRGMQLDGAAAGFSGSSTSGRSDRSDRMRIGLVVAEGEQAPTGTISVPIQRASICLCDTWTVAWDAPTAGDEVEGHPAPLTLHPQEAAQTQNGLTVTVEEAVLTDRLTGVELELENAPPDVTLGSPLRWTGPGVLMRGLVLEDDRGRRYEQAGDVLWQPIQALEPHLTGFTFKTIQPLARRLTLRVPALAVTKPGNAAFDVNVPEGLTPTYDARGTHDPPWPTSASWDVDLPVEVGGYLVQFTEARLEEFGGITQVTLVSEPYEAARTKQLSGLHLASVKAPDGRDVDLGSAYSAAGPQEEDSEMHQMRLRFDVVDLETLRVEAGRYHVEIDGITVMWQGPWELSWELPAP